MGNYFENNLKVPTSFMDIYYLLYSGNEPYVLIATTISVTLSRDLVRLSITPA